MRLQPASAVDLVLEEADIFDWDADGRVFDTIIFSAWLHHVPHDRFDEFWSLVEGLLAPGGVVVFDFLDATVPSPGKVEVADEPSGGYTFHAPSDGVSIRDLDGHRWRVVHVLWAPDELRARLLGRGWEVAVLGPGLLSNMRWAAAHR
ncbi:class I SAM-dependent methyltransferase [Iamia majanohamensis]|uniref:Class I SAM-dependent methyltransferase n=1 Tax=Iamia majanohamensis TaxID=467976 RepID=A0AAE9YIK4_9ACTN|nr:class I SAM-dependent methyltransferase [Iamia majanohamensis]WCO68621.1 class I SAM-dependent methyltransferase [Iamia majanohamensis]